MENRRTHLNYLGEGRLEQARTKYIRAKPYNPGSTMMPLNRRLMGEGATEWASGSQKWKGATAALTRNAVAMRAKAAIQSIRGGMRLTWAAQKGLFDYLAAVT